MLPPALGDLRFRVSPIPKPLGFWEYVNDQRPTHGLRHVPQDRRIIANLSEVVLSMPKNQQPFGQSWSKSK